MPRIKSLPLKILVPLLAIAIFSIASYAASVSVTTTTYQGAQGVLYNVAGGFTATSNGFNVVPSSASAVTCANTLWAATGSPTCSTALTAGDWEFSLQIALTATAPTSHADTVTVTWNTGSGYSTMSGGTVTINTPTTITAGNYIIILLDTGSASFNAPAGITVTIS